MRFRPHERVDDSATDADEGCDDEELRIRQSQSERLTRLGFREASAAMIVADAWGSGEHTDLVHRIERLIARGATHEQAARIVAPASEGCPSAA